MTTTTKKMSNLPGAVALLCLATLTLVAGQARGQNHFRPILGPPQLGPLPAHLFYTQPRGHQHQAAAAAATYSAPVITTPSRGANGLIASLGSRGQSYFNQMVQQHTRHQQQQQQQQQQQRQRQHQQLAGHFLMSDRRASPAAASPAVAVAPAGASVDNQLLQQDASLNQQAQAGLYRQQQQQHQYQSQQQQQQQHQQHQRQQRQAVPVQTPKNQEGTAQQAEQNNGKLLICYYTTKQTAPYWPRDAREFVLPSDRLSQLVASVAANKSPEAGEGVQQAAARFSAQINQQQQQQRHERQIDNLISREPASARQASDGLGPQTVKHYNQYGALSGGRMIVVAPKFVPFNRTNAASGQSRASANEPPALSGGGGRTSLSSQSFAQMLFMPQTNAEHHQRHNIIASRQDNAVSITTTGTTSQPLPPAPHSPPPPLPPPPPPGAQFSPAVAQVADLIVPDNDRFGGGGGGGAGGIVFDENQHRGNHDLHGGANGARNVANGGLLTIINGPSSSSSSLVKTNSIRQQAASHLLFSQNNGAHVVRQPMQASVNNKQLDHGGQLRHLVYSAPPMSRTFVVGASVGPPLDSSAGNIENQDKLLGQIVPLVNADNSDYYYYYSQPTVTSGGAPDSPTKAGVSGINGHVVATTESLDAQSYRPAQQQQQQQQQLHLNSNIGIQKGKSLQVAESGLSPALPASSQMPIKFVDSPSSSPPSYSLSDTAGHQSPTLDRLIVSNGPPAAVHQSQHSSATVASSQMHSTGFTQSDLFKMSSGDDGLISSGTKTTPIASVASPATSPSSSSAPTTASQQLVATLPGSLLISYPPSLPSTTSNTLAQPPNGSSTAAATTAAAAAAATTTASQTLSSQLAAGSGSAVNVNTNSDPSSGNNRHHHQQQQQQQQQQHNNNNNNNNNRQTVGVGGNSLSATLVSSPLSTMFDVFGAASQYLMRFKPSSLISPSSFASLNSIVGESSGHQQSPRSNSSSPLVSLPFAGGILGAAGLHYKSNNSNTGFLSRLSLQTHQRREDICGRTIQTAERRIIGGEGAKYGEFPYQVHIKIAKHQCGGALIDKQSIVTAAHCVYHFITRAPVSKLQIVIGAYDIEDEQYQELPPQYFKVNRVKLHPNFRFSASHPDRYDIAILKLDKPVKYTDNVLPVCLPGKDLKYENMVGTVTGFGKTDPSLSNRYGTRLLQKVDVPIIENGECERWHRTRGIDLKIFPEMMCAGYEDGLKDACVGDSGGPLVVRTPVGSNGSFRWTLAGITSAGFGCAQSRQPGIYHRVSHTVDWILDNLD